MHEDDGIGESNRCTLGSQEAPMRKGGRHGCLLGEKRAAKHVARFALSDARSAGRSAVRFAEFVVPYARSVGRFAGPRGRFVVASARHAGRFVAAFARRSARRFARSAAAAVAPPQPCRRTRPQ